MTSAVSNAPKVSVIVPNYNYANFLEQRLNSIVRQTFRDFEVIFLDDASSDASVALVQEKFSTAISVMDINPVNTGNPFVQWNRGVRQAKGEYIWIAEADDFCEPDFLERMVAVLDKHPSVGLAYCLTTPVDLEGRVIDADFFDHFVSDLLPNRWADSYVSSGVDEIDNALLFKNTITNVSGVLFRKQSYIKSGYAAENLRMCGDWLSYCRILTVSDAAFVRSALNFHRQHPAKLTLNSVLNLTYFREYLQVQKYLQARLVAPEKKVDAALKRFLHEWDRLTYSNYGRITLLRTFRTAGMAASNYPGIGRLALICTHLIRNTTISLASKWIRN